MERYQENSRRTRRVEAVQTVLAHLTRHIVHEPIAATSDHYKAPQLPVETPITYDDMGMYHDDDIRIEKPVQLNNRWDVI